MPELLPVVDKNDKVRQYRPSKLIHAQELRHREIVVYLIDATGKILVQKRDGGYFDHSVAGHVRKGESYLQAALREVKEEVDLTLTARDLKCLGKFYHRTLSPQKGYHNDRFFTLYVVKDPVALSSLRINKHELESIKPLSIKQIQTIMRKNPKKCKGGFLISFPLLLKQRQKGRLKMLPPHFSGGSRGVSPATLP